MCIYMHVCVYIYIHVCIHAYMYDVCVCVLSCCVLHMNVTLTSNYLTDRIIRL